MEKSSMKELAKRILPSFLVSRIRRRRYVKGFQNYRPTLRRQRFGGHDLVVEIVDRLGESWYAHDWSLPPEIPLLESSRLKPGAVVFDLGAHQCVMAMLLSKSVGCEGSVLAVEGSFANARAGMRNVELNAISNCKVIHGAVSGKTGILSFDGLGNGSMQTDPSRPKAWHSEVVQGYSIDDLAALHGIPDVVYLDVEGYECEVLKGATKTFETKPDWFIEVHQQAGLERYAGSVEEILSYFSKAKGYQSYVARPTERNDYSDWNEFKALQNERYPSGRFYLVAISTEQRLSKTA